MIVLLDLDGTLTDTAHADFKPYKDGLRETVIADIPVFEGAVKFIAELKALGHLPFIVSDSHPKYVNKIAQEIFGFSIEEDSLNQIIYLADKPNIEKTRDYLSAFAHELDPHIPMIHLPSDKDEFILIGDSWLDIELGRRLNIRTILTQFYKTTSIEKRDGIGQDWKPIKTGPTYYANSFSEIMEIIENPISSLLSIEAIFQGENSSNAVRFLYRKYENGFTIFRCLARQEDGECDRFARADKYYQIGSISRTAEFIGKLAQAVTNYLNKLAAHPNYPWHYITYVPDKKTTKPPDKMKAIFDLIQSPFPKETLFDWDDNVAGNLREQPNYEARRNFISNYLHTMDEVDLRDKNVIVVDDQFTSSATANEISMQLRQKGAKNILFIALFYLILPVSSKMCPKCGKPMKIKIKREDGHKFFSCVPPKFRGEGCGHIENMN